MNRHLKHDLRSTHKTQWAISKEINGLVIGLCFGNYISGDGAHCATVRPWMFWTFYAPPEHYRWRTPTLMSLHLICAETMWLFRRFPTRNMRHNFPSRCEITAS